MNRKDIITGLIVVIILAVVIFLFKRGKDNLQVPQETNVPSVEENIQSAFNIEIPEGVEKMELKDISGGDASGIATKDTVLADLPEPGSGYFYQVWVEKDGELTSLGKMWMVKGGYLFNGKIDEQKVVVSKEKVLDATPETKILEGSF
ncbi:anti-sigma factor [Patescibacteria group bacterium]